VDLLAAIADGWSKARARQLLWERLRQPVRELRPGRDGGEGLSDEARGVFPEGAQSDALVPKFQAPESLRLLGVCPSNGFEGSATRNAIAHLAQDRRSR
jgi:hypothetical protein